MRTAGRTTGSPKSTHIFMLGEYMQITHFMAFNHSAVSSEKALYGYYPPIPKRNRTPDPLLPGTKCRGRPSCRLKAQ